MHPIEVFSDSGNADTTDRTKEVTHHTSMSYINYIRGAELQGNTISLCLDQTNRNLLNYSCHFFSLKMRLSFI